MTVGTAVGFGISAAALGASAVLWCDACGVPLLQRECEACGDPGRVVGSNAMRPVFAEEVSLLREQFSAEFPSADEDFALWSIGRVYYRDGRALARVRGTHDFGLELLCQEHGAANRGLRPQAEVIRHLWRANRTALDCLEYEAVGFIREAIHAAPERVPIVSYSTGKDSAVVSHLVMLALGRADTIHVFGDTTIELPNTYQALEALPPALSAAPLLTAYPRTGFFEMAAAIGPPSRVQRWCCTTHKTVPLSEMFRHINGDQGVLAFCGLRRSESLGRTSVPRVSRDTKIPVQVIANPILYWSTTAVWVYALCHGVQINSAYRLGFTRVGCYPCPLNSAWSEFLIRTYYPGLYGEWQSALLQHAAHWHLGDSGTYVATGGWKGRVGGRSDARASRYSLDRRPCLDTELACNYVLKGGWREHFTELLKPLGVLRVLSDDHQTARLLLLRSGTQSPALLISVSRPRATVHVQYLSSDAQRTLQALVEAQIRKVQLCVGCGACASLCPNGAIRLEGNVHRIDSRLCTHCLACIRRIRYGCLAADSLHT